MIKFLIKHGVLIIALAALIQPWLISIWKKFFIKSYIDIFETGKIEIGYSTFGPTIGLVGTLRCTNGDFFIREIQVNLIKTKDSSSHKFNWGVFRTEKLTNTGDESSFELPYGFLLSTTLPRRYSIQFHDLQTQSELQNITNKVSEEWSSILYESMKDNPEQSFNQTSSEAELSQFSIYQEFSKTPIHVNSYTSLDRLCYWEIGEYSIEMIVFTSNPNHNFRNKWSFSINDKDQAQLRLNVVKIMQDVCGRSSFSKYNFSYADYISLKNELKN